MTIVDLELRSLVVDANIGGVTFGSSLETVRKLWGQEEDRGYPDTSGRYTIYKYGDIQLVFSSGLDHLDQFIVLVPVDGEIQGYGQAVFARNQFPIGLSLSQVVATLGIARVSSMSERIDCDYAEVIVNRHSILSFDAQGYNSCVLRKIVVTEGGSGAHTIP